MQEKSFRRKSDAPGEEVKSPRRKVIRVESEDTQDCVTEAKDLDQEEAEEISFVPSALSVRNRCSEKTLSSWQFASVVIKEVRNHTRPIYASNVATNLRWQEEVSH